MTTRVVIIGAGGFGREVHDWLQHWAADEALGGHKVDVLGFLDDGKAERALLERVGATHLGGIDRLAEFDAVYYVAVGDPAARERIVAQCAAMGAKPGPALVHPTAVVGSDVRLGPGTIVCPLVVVSTNVRVGAHTQLNPAATVAHDVFVGDCVTVSPGANIGGNVTIGDRVWVGVGSCVKQGLSIRPDAVIGAGAAVVKDVPAGTVVAGVPARPLRPRSQG